MENAQMTSLVLDFPCPMQLVSFVHLNISDLYLQYRAQLFLAQLALMELRKLRRSWVSASEIQRGSKLGPLGRGAMADTRSEIKKSPGSLRWWTEV